MTLAEPAVDLHSTAARRLSTEDILFRARHLPPKQRACFIAFYEAGIPTRELAALLDVNPRLMLRRIARWRTHLQKPEFLLAAKFGPRLPPPYRELAHAHWIEGRNYRQLAAEKQVTLHQVRKQMGISRSLLLAELSSLTKVDAATALALLEGKPVLADRD